jgi:hypothetical protein
MDDEAGATQSTTLTEGEDERGDIRWCGEEQDRDVVGITETLDECRIEKVESDHVGDTELESTDAPRPIVLDGHHEPFPHRGLFGGRRRPGVFVQPELGEHTVDGFQLLGRVRVVGYDKEDDDGDAKGQSAFDDENPTVPSTPAHGTGNQAKRGGSAPLPSRDTVFARETTDDARADQPAKGARQTDTTDVKRVTTTNLRARVYKVCMSSGINFSEIGNEASRLHQQVSQKAAPGKKGPSHIPRMKRTATSVPSEVVAAVQVDTIAHSAMAQGWASQHDCRRRRVMALTRKIDGRDLDRIRLAGGWAKMSCPMSVMFRNGGDVRSLTRDIWTGQQLDRTTYEYQEHWFQGEARQAKTLTEDTIDQRVLLIGDVRRSSQARHPGLGDRISVEVVGHILGIPSVSSLSGTLHRGVIHHDDDWEHDHQVQFPDEGPLAL